MTRSTPWMYGLKNAWKGDNAGYAAVHLRMRQSLPKRCALADKTCKGNLQVALKKGAVTKTGTNGVEYSVKSDDYWRLCRSHHNRYDDCRK